MADTDTSVEAVERECRNIHECTILLMIPPMYGQRWQDLLRAIAAERDKLEAENERLKKLLAEKTLDCLAAEGQASNAYEEPFSEYGHYGENNPPVGMSSPSDKDYEV